VRHVASSRFQEVAWSNRIAGVLTDFVGLAVGSGAFQPALLVEPDVYELV